MTLSTGFGFFKAIIWREMGDLSSNSKLMDSIHDKNSVLSIAPTNLTLDQFEQFILPYMSTGRRWPVLKLTLY